MNTDPVSALITFLLGGGLVTFLTQGRKVWFSMRSGARAASREVLKDLAASRDEAEDRLGREQREKEHWRYMCGRYHFQLVRAGLDPDPVDPTPRAAEQRRRRPDGPRAEDSP